MYSHLTASAKFTAFDSAQFSVGYDDDYLAWSMEEQTRNINVAVTYMCNLYVVLREIKRDVEY